MEETVDENTFSLDELIEITKKGISDLIESDPLLQDLPRDITLEEVTSQLALQHGQSMTIYVHKESGQIIPVVVPLRCRVVDLKRAIKRYITLWLKRSSLTSNQKLSWRYVWRTNVLVSENVELDDDNAPLSQFEIRNKSKVRFMKKLHHKNCSKRKKH